MKPIIVGIDDLMRVCGYANGETHVNNHYGCDHPDQEETDIDRDTKKEQGKCYSFSCPLAGECDLQDLKEMRNLLQV